jgi:recombination protein RecA
MYGEGISRSGELLDLGVEHRLVTKSGTWLSYGDARLGQGRENARAFLKDHPDVMTELEEKLRGMLPALARPASAAEEP